MYVFFEWICMIGALAALCYTLPRLARHPTDPPLVAICVYFTCSFLSYTLGLSFVAPHIADLFGYRNAPTILIHSVVIVLTAAQQVVLIHWSYPLETARVKARRRLAAFGAVLVVLIAMFAAALPSKRHNAESVTLLNMGNPRFDGYLLLYIAVVAAGQVITMRLSVRYAGIVRRAWLRRGMWLVAAGAGFILVYCAIRVAEIIGVLYGVDMASWDQVQWYAGDVGSLLELVGWTIPGWGRALSSARLRAADYLTYHRLYPLWAAVYEAVPSIAKDPRRSQLADLLPARGLEHRLYRRVIEILDGQLALRPFTHACDADRARRQARDLRLGDDARQAAVEALRLRAALRAKADDRAAGEPAEAFCTAPVDDLPAQVRWLTMVAAAFKRTRAMDASAASSRGPGPRRRSRERGPR